MLKTKFMLDILKQAECILIWSLFIPFIKAILTENRRCSGISFKGFNKDIQNNLSASSS